MSPSHTKHAFRLLTGPHFILLHQEGPPQMQSSLHLPLFPYLCQTVQFLKHLCWEAEQAMPQASSVRLSQQPQLTPENSRISAGCVTAQSFSMMHPYFPNLYSPLFKCIRAALAFC